MSRKRHDASGEGDGDEAAPPPLRCWLCERPMGQLIQWHHPIPRAKGGKARVAVHPICHHTVHEHFTNSQLARIGENVAAVRAEPPVADFLRWIAGKPPDFHAPTRSRKDR